MTDDRDATDRAAYEATRNPLHVWAAIGSYSANEPLPLWIRRYLMQITRELMGLWRQTLDGAISPQEAQKLAKDTLWPPGKGLNRFAEVKQRREDTFVETLESKDFVTVRELSEIMQMDERSVRKILARVRLTRP